MIVWNISSGCNTDLTPPEQNSFACGEYSLSQQLRSVFYYTQGIFVLYDNRIDNDNETVVKDCVRNGSFITYGK